MTELNKTILKRWVLNNSYLSFWLKNTVGLSDSRMLAFRFVMLNAIDKNQMSVYLSDNFVIKFFIDFNNYRNVLFQIEKPLDALTYSNVFHVSFDNQDSRPINEQTFIEI